MPPQKKSVERIDRLIKANCRAKAHSPEVLHKHTAKGDSTEGFLSSISRALPEHGSILQPAARPAGKSNTTIEGEQTPADACPTSEAASPVIQCETT